MSQLPNGGTTAETGSDMFYGWGRNSKQWQMQDGLMLICGYSYVSLMFIFKLAYKKRWMLAGNDRNMDRELTRAEVEGLYGEDAPQLGLWTQYGLLITVGLLIAAVFLSATLQSLF